MAERTAQKVGGVRVLKRPNKREGQTEEWDSGEEEEIRNVVESAGYSTSKEVESPLDDTITAVNSPARRRGRPPGSKNKAAVEKIPQLTDQGLGLSNLTLGVLNSGVVAMFGPECGLLPGEATVLQPPLARIIARLPAGDAAKAAVFIDPLVLIFGLAVWGRRIILLKQSERARINAITTEEFLRSTGVTSGIPQPEPARVSETPPNQFRNGADTTTSQIHQNPSSAVTGGIPTEILQSFSSDDSLNGH